MLAGAGELRVEDRGRSPVRCWSRNRGGSRGIGRSSVLNLAARGVNVIFTCNTNAGLADEVAAEAGKMAYAMNKGAIEPMTRYLAVELGPRGIRVNMLAPGATATDFSGGVIRDDPDCRRRVADITALGRAAYPEEIGPIVACLLSDDMCWIDGERIEASGGMKL